MQQSQFHLKHYWISLHRILIVLLQVVPNLNVRKQSCRNRNQGLLNFDHLRILMKRLFFQTLEPSLGTGHMCLMN